MILRFETCGMTYIKVTSIIIEWYLTDSREGKYNQGNFNNN